MANVHFTAHSPISAALPKYTVVAVKDFVSARGRRISQGEYLMIDPNRDPCEGDTVLVEDQMQKWSGQPEIDGVLCGVFVDER